MHLFLLCSILVMGAPAGENDAPAGKNPAQTHRRAIALLPLNALGVDPDLAEQLDSLLRQSTASIPGIRLVSSNAPAPLCTSGPECALKWARQRGGDVVVYGAVAAFGDAYNVTLRALTTGSGREIGRTQVGCSGSRDALILAMRQAAFRLLAPAEARGALVLQSQERGLTVTLDGQPLGTTPLHGVPLDLPEGEHLVQARRNAVVVASQTVTVTAFTTTHVMLAAPTLGAEASDSSQK